MTYGAKSQPDAYRITFQYGLISKPLVSYRSSDALSLDRRVEELEIGVKGAGQGGYATRWSSGYGLNPETVGALDLDQDGRVDLEHSYDHRVVRHTDSGWVDEELPPPSPTSDWRGFVSAVPRLTVRLTRRVSRPV